VRTIPSVRRGTPEPDEAGQYRQMTVNGATVYVHTSMSELGNVEIDAADSIFGSKLVLKGVQTTNTGGCCG
jgi:hypothetical protein